MKCQTCRITMTLMGHAEIIFKLESQLMTAVGIASNECHYCVCLAVVTTLGAQKAHG